MTNTLMTIMWRLAPAKAPKCERLTHSPQRPAMDGMLRAFRTKTATELGQPAYCVFSNKELDALVAARPQSLVDLRNVPGFGPAKIQKFGDEIIRIVCAMPAPASGSSVGAVPEMPSISGKRKLPAAFGGANAQPPTPPLPAPPSVTIPRTALNEEQRSAADRVLVGENCFLTGAAGTGKSFLLRYIIQQLEARHPGGVAVTAPTGIAASHVQGVTIHSWAGFGLGKGTISKLVDKVTSNATACQRWSRAHALLIDEVSMLDSHLFDALDAIGRAVCPDGTHRPFGGLQLILCGDFFQWGLLRLEPMRPRSRPRALGTARSAPLSAPRSRRSLPTCPCAHRMPTPPAL